ncbi:hypothetical protein [Streptomyces sp. NPDC087525]|uniref:hypothetical protein n=1 Tax=Streptomyces sp. NPDC087525 TaxID=3365793 RepID=UPI0037F45F47
MSQPEPETRTTAGQPVALRDRIAEALRPGSRDRSGHYPEGLMRDVDAVLAVLPEPADRAAVLNEAAARLTRLIAAFREIAINVNDANTRSAIIKFAEGAEWAANLLRRWAHEAQQPTAGEQPVPDTGRRSRWAATWIDPAAQDGLTAVHAEAIRTMKARLRAVADEEQRDLLTMLRAERAQADGIISGLRAELEENAGVMAALRRQRDKAEAEAARLRAELEQARATTQPGPVSQDGAQ